VKVLLTTEGTYPFTAGGVSTWCEQMLQGLPEHEFTVLSVIANPHVDYRYDVPANTRILPVPLWGIEHIEEYVQLPGLLRRKVWPRGGGPVRDRLLPAVEELLDTMLLRVGSPERIAACLLELADYADRWDLRRALRTRAVWTLFTDRLRAHPLFRMCSLEGVIGCGQSIYRYLLPITVPLPEDLDVGHATAAAFCALPTVCARLQRGLPFLLTEHGVYLRERILSLVRDGTPTLQKILLGNFYRAIVAVSYHLADRILPVCEFNTLWEERVDPSTSERTRVIPNGVPTDRFAPLPDATDPGPVAVFVGRVDPLKDLETLLGAIALVRQVVPDVRLEVWGPETDPGYSAALRHQIAEAGMGAAVEFHGPTSVPVDAFHRGRVVVQSSVSEGMPFSLLEAMSCGRVVVATAVGGVPEVLEPGPWLVPPQDPRALAASLTEALCLTEEESAAVGEGNRRRILQRFAEEQMLAAYDEEYRLAAAYHREAAA
jgi:glycosyltransferase involved in cell wall biosynthesis